MASKKSYPKESEVILPEAVGSLDASLGGMGMSVPPSPPLPATGPRVLPSGRVARGRGWIAGSDWSQYRPVRHLVGAPRGLPSSAMDMDRLISRICDQGQSSSCCGQAGARVLHILRWLEQGGVGTPEPEYPAVLGLYTPARMLERADGSTPIQDVGTYPELVLKVANKLGVLNEKDFPFTDDPVAINRVFTEADFRKAYDFRAWGYVVDSEGGHRVDDVMNALSKGYPLTGAIDVDQNFEEYSGGTIDPPNGTILGGHDIAIVGYEGGGSSGLRFRAVNSWSRSWGEAGEMWFSAESIIAMADLVAYTRVAYA